MSPLRYVGLALLMLACGGTGEPQVSPDALTDAWMDAAAAEVVATSCGELVTGPVGLLPRPRRVYRWGEVLAVATATVTFEGVSGEEAMRFGSLLAVPDGEDGVAANLTVRFHPADAVPEHLGACGGDFPAESYLLGVSGTSPATVDIYAPDERGRFYAVQTLRQLVVAGGVRDVLVYDEPAIGLRGIIEGFYGQPWEPEARLDMVARLGALKMNTYVYAPKGADSINTAWMLPFGDEEVAHFKALAKVARENHVDVCFEMHPSFAFHYSSDEDMATLLGKFDVVVDAGISCLVLAFDDVSPVLVTPDTEVYLDVTEAQADFVPRFGAEVLSRHPGVKLAFVPMEYFSNHDNADAAWPVFAAALGEEWEIAWTGQQIGSSTITLSDALAAQELMGRKPLLGDNYPVSDDAYKTGLIHLGPLKGRTADLVDGVSGLTFNAMPLPYASLPALATCADYAWNPAAYQAEDSILRAAGLYADVAGAVALTLLTANNRSPMLEASYAPILEGNIDSFWDAWEGKGLLEQAAGLLDETFSLWQKVPEVFAGGGVLPALVDELQPWVEQLGRYGEAGVVAVDLLRKKRSGESVDTGPLVELMAEIDSSFARPTGDLMTNFLLRVAEEL